MYDAKVKNVVFDAKDDRTGQRNNTLVLEKTLKGKKWTSYFVDMKRPVFNKDSKENAVQIIEEELEKIKIVCIFSNIKLASITYKLLVS